MLLDTADDNSPPSLFANYPPSYMSAREQQALAREEAKRKEEMRVAAEEEKREKELRRRRNKIRLGEVLKESLIGFGEFRESEGPSLANTMGGSEKSGGWYTSRNFDFSKSKYNDTVTELSVRKGSSSFRLTTNSFKKSPFTYAEKSAGASPEPISHRRANSYKKIESLLDVLASKNPPLDAVRLCRSFLKCSDCCRKWEK